MQDFWVVLLFLVAFAIILGSYWSLDYWFLNKTVREHSPVLDKAHFVVEAVAKVILTRKEGITALAALSIDEYGQFTVDNWIHATGSEPEPLESLFIMTAGLGGETGEVLEKIKKYVRDGTLDIPALEKELGDVLYYWARICRFFNLQPTQVMAANVEKLRSRRERGTLRGSGDNR